LSEGWIQRHGGAKGRNRLGQPPRLQAQKSQVVMDRGLARRDARGFLQRQNGLRRTPGTEALGRVDQ
jgi:hypothetical protein